MYRKDRSHGASSGVAAFNLSKAVITGAGYCSTSELVATPVRCWVPVGCEVGGEVGHVGSKPEPLGGVAELPVAAGRRRQVLVCIGLAVRGAACNIELGPLWPWTNVDPGVAVTAAGGVVGC